MSSRKGNNKRRKELGAKILNLFGHGEGKYIVLTQMILTKALGLDKGETHWVVSPLIDEMKVATLVNQNGDEIYLARNVTHNKHRFYYTSAELVTLLNSKYFDKVGEFLSALLADGGATYINPEFLEKYDGQLGIPGEILKQIINCFVEADLVKLGKNNKLTETSIGKNTRLGYDALKNAFIAQRFTGQEIISKPPIINTLDDVERVYNRHNDSTRVKTLKIKLDKPEVKIQGLMEALIGNQDLDLGYLKRELDLLEKMPKENLPDILVVSGIIQGGFQHQEKTRRLTLAMKSERQQFQVAKMVFDRCSKLGIKKIIYNCGDDDQKLWEMHTVDALMIMEEWSRKKKDGTTKDSAKRSVNYKQLDDLKRTKAWDFHYDFQARVVFEYMLRSGRRLYSADEVGEKHGRRMEEYLMLLETYASLKKGEGMPDAFYSQVLQVENIPLPGREFSDFVVTTDFNAEIKLSTGKVIRLWERHDWNLTPTAMKQDPTKFVRGLVGQLEAAGAAKRETSEDGKKVVANELPHVFAIEHQEQCSGVLQGRTLVTSYPSVRCATLDRDSITGRVQKDKVRRILTTRGELPFPATQSLTLTSDDRYLIELRNDRLLNKMGISSERATVVFLSDWQTGSVTARPDLQVLTLDYVFHQLLPKNHVHLVFCGDIIQGRNYPEMANENVRMGLVRIRDQQRFVRRMLQNSMESVPKANYKNMKRVMTTDGNHEWNSSHKLTGDSHSEYLTDTLEDFFRYNGLDVPVKYYDKVRSVYGEHWNSWTAVEEIAGYTVLAQHYILERGGKGSSGIHTNPARALFEGTGDLAQEVDVILSGHYHSPTYQLINNKIVLVNGSWAGTSGYEWMLGYRPMMGTMCVHLGGVLPPVVEIITQKTIHDYKARGYYSDENLSKLGFVTDKGWNAREHGFARIFGQPQSAAQKALWAAVDEINGTMHSVLGPRKK